MPVLFGGDKMRGLVEAWLTLTDLAKSGGAMAPPAPPAPLGMTFDLRLNSARGRLSLIGTVTLDCEGAVAPPDFARSLMASPGMTFNLLCNPAPVSLTGTVTLDCEGFMAPPDFARSLKASPGMTFDLLGNPFSVSLTGTVALDCEGAMAPPDFAR